MAFFSLQEQINFIKGDRVKYKIFEDKTDKEVHHLFAQGKITQSHLNFLKIKKMFKIFPNLPDESVLDLINNVAIKNFHKNQYVFEHGDTKKEFFYVLTGEIAILQRKIELASLKKGDLFGETIFVTDKPRDSYAQIKSKVANIFSFTIQDIEKGTRLHSLFLENIAKSISEKLIEAQKQLLESKICSL
ncbi:cyclic nucleotide-binding protein [Thiovulum sp. ES]|nr:cyclic nucleotide-binding protein [Thiovulum sp. ES]